MPVKQSDGYGKIAHIDPIVTDLVATIKHNKTKHAYMP